MTAPAIFVPAWAKINLTLSVLKKREDGFHALTSVMQTISLNDTLRIQTTDIVIVTCAVDIQRTANDNNLALRAARLLRDEGYLQAESRSNCANGYLPKEGWAGAAATPQQCLRRSIGSACWL